MIGVLKTILEDENLYKISRHVSNIKIINSYHFYMTYINKNNN